MTDPLFHKDFEEILVSKNEEEAGVIKGLLESSGVPVLLKNAAGWVSSVHPINPGEGIKILVPKNKAETAKEIIDAFKEK